MNYLLHRCCVQFSANQFALHAFLLDHQLWANQSWGFVYCRRQGNKGLCIIILVLLGYIDFWSKLFSLWCILSIFTHRIVFFKFGWILCLWGKSFVLQCSFPLVLPSEIWLWTRPKSTCRQTCQNVPGDSVAKWTLCRFYWANFFTLLSCTSYMQVHTIYEVHSLTVCEHFQH